MALIYCPECKKEISDRAISCPQCGFPLSPAGVNTDTNPGGDSNRSMELIRMQKVLVYLIFLAGLILLIPCLSANWSSVTLIASGALIGLAIVWFVLILVQKKSRRK